MIAAVLVSSVSWVSSPVDSLEPDLNFIAIRISHVRVREARSKLATTEKASPCAFDLGNSTVDVARIHEPKSEMCDTASETGRAGVLGEREDIVPPSRLSVDEPVSAPIFTQTEDLLVEPKGAVKLPDCQIDMSQAVGGDHRDLEKCDLSTTIFTRI
jgi:hypothetical protein